LLAKRGEFRLAKAKPRRKGAMAGDASDGGKEEVLIEKKVETL